MQRRESLATAASASLNQRQQSRFIMLVAFIAVLVVMGAVLHYSHSRTMLVFEERIAHALEGPMHVLDRSTHDRPVRASLRDGVITAATAADSSSSGVTLAGGATAVQPVMEVVTLAEQIRREQGHAERQAEAAEKLAKEEKLYVTLSSVPGRLPRTLPVLRGLVNQTRPADAIFLALPWWSTRESKFYQLPRFLRPGGEMYGKVTVLRDQYDWGPATKMITLIRKLKARGEHNARVLIVDDDQIYYHTMLELYDKWSQKLPNNALTMRGHKTIEGNFDWWTLLSHNMMHAYEVADETCVDIMTAVGTYMVRPRFFTDELWEGLYVHGRDNDKAGKLQGARNADDVWISGMLAHNKVPRSIIPGRSKAWDDSMPVEQYERDMLVKPWVLIHFKGTPELGGGGGEDNAMLLRFFKDDWGCRGQIHTMASCQVVADKNGVRHQQRLMPTAPCRKTDGSGYLDGAVFNS